MGYIKWTNTVGVPEGEERGKGAESLSKEIMAKRKICQPTILCLAK